MHPKPNNIRLFVVGANAILAGLRARHRRQVEILRGVHLCRSEFWDRRIGDDAKNRRTRGRGQFLRVLGVGAAAAAAQPLVAGAKADRIVSRSTTSCKKNQGRRSVSPRNRDRAAARASMCEVKHPAILTEPGEQENRTAYADMDTIPRPETRAHRECARERLRAMTLDERQAELGLLLTRMQNEPADRHELYLQIMQRLNELKAYGMPLPQDLLQFQRRLEAEFADDEAQVAFTS